MVLEAMLRNTPLVAYLQQMEQLLSEEVALQAKPVTYPRGAAYKSPPPAVPRAFPGELCARHLIRLQGPLSLGPAAPKQAGLQCRFQSLWPGDRAEVVTA